MLVHGLLDRLILLLGVLAGGALPGFVQEYRQRIGGRLDEARAQLAEWQSLADRLFGGDLDALVEHHRRSGDTTFQAEAELIEQVGRRVTDLDQVYAALDGALWERAAGFLTHAEWADVQATWAIYQPQFPLHPESLLFALGFGGALWLFWLGLVHGLARLGRRPRGVRRHLAD